MRGALAAVGRRVDSYFEISDRGSSVAQELRGGFASFLTMSYILLVNPQILTAWLNVPEHVPKADWLSEMKESMSKDIATATAMTCGFGCVLVGLLSNMPFTIGPGMGLNTFVAGLLITTYASGDVEGEIASFENAHKTWGQVCTVTFLVGALLTVMSAVGLVSPVITNMPETLKTAIMVGIGAYQAFVGFREMGIIKASGLDLVGIESFNNESFSWDEQYRSLPTSAYAQILFIIGLLTTAVLFYRNVKGSILLGIALCTVVGWAGHIGGGKFPLPPVSSPQFSNNTLNTLDFAALFKNGDYLKKFLPEIFVIIIITVFDCGGVQFGVAKLLDLPVRYAEAAEARRRKGASHASLYTGQDEHDDDGDNDTSISGDEAVLEAALLVPNSTLARSHDTSASCVSVASDTQVRRASMSVERGTEVTRLEHHLRQLLTLEADGVDGLADAKERVRDALRRLRSNDQGGVQKSGNMPVAGSLPTGMGSINDADTLRTPSVTSTLHMSNPRQFSLDLRQATDLRGDASSKSALPASLTDAPQGITSPGSLNADDVPISVTSPPDGPVDSIPYRGSSRGRGGSSVQGNVPAQKDKLSLLPDRASQWTFICLGLVNMFGSFFGSSPCIVFLECAAGVKEGARTGLASVFAGLMFLLTTVLTPVFQNVPLCASAGPLVFIGCLMMSHVGSINWDDLLHSLPAFLTILMMPFTSSITPGVGFGIFFYVVLRLLVKAFDACIGPCKKPPLIHVATKKGDISEIKRLVDEHPEALDAADYKGNTALHVAALEGGQEVIQVLLALGANCNIVNRSDLTPLELSLQQGSGAYSSLAYQCLLEATHATPAQRSIRLD